MPGFNLPIRVKILLASILMLMLVVGLITASMARLFQNDKTVYMRDLTSVVARNVSEEANALFASYVRNLRIFMGAARDADTGPDERQRLIKAMFDNYGDFVAISIIRPGIPATMVYDPAVLSEAGLEKRDLLRFQDEHPLPTEDILGGRIHVRNATISERLPSMTVALRDPYSPPEEATIVVGTIRMTPLLNIAARSSTFDIKLFDSGGAVLASANRVEVAGRQRDEALLRAAERDISDPVRKTRDLELRGQEWIASFENIADGGVIASIMIPKSAAYLTARDLLRNLTYISLALFAIAVTLALMFSHRLTRPLEVLSNAASKIGKGEFNVSVEQAGRDEIGLLAASFNNMTGALRQRDQDLEDAHRALVQSEKMAAFGQLGAGIAHEVKNPLAGILGYAQLALRKTNDDSPVKDKLRIIEKEAKRCSEIISNLMRFARHERAEYQPTDINSVVADAVAIVDHQLSINDNKVTVDLAENLPQVHGNANQIQQVLINLLINAEQALAEQHGEISVTTRSSESGDIEIEVCDNGPGIPAEIQDRIFEPFFTTKPSGKGTGLGMSVAYRIIDEHRGNIRLRSEPGHGACFRILLPALAPITGA